MQYLYLYLQYTHIIKQKYIYIYYTYITLILCLTNCTKNCYIKLSQFNLINIYLHYTIYNLCKHELMLHRQKSK